MTAWRKGKETQMSKNKVCASPKSFRRYKKELLRMQLRLCHMRSLVGEK